MLFDGYETTCINCGLTQFEPNYNVFSPYPRSLPLNTLFRGAILENRAPTTEATDD